MIQVYIYVYNILTIFMCRTCVGDSSVRPLEAGPESELGLAQRGPEGWLLCVASSLHRSYPKSSRSKL